MFVREKTTEGRDEGALAPQRSVLNSAYACVLTRYIATPQNTHITAGPGGL